MTNKIVYGFVFISAFILVTSIIVMLNMQYENIFKFDFTPVEKKNEASQIDKAVMAAMIERVTQEVRQELLDSLTADGKNYLPELDTNQNTVNAHDIDMLKLKIEELAEMNRQVEAKRAEEKQPEIKEPLVDTSKEEFTAWVKKTAKLFESMDSKKAAKILLKYSDNESKEIIYTMNKKKAAEILAQLNPDDAIKMTQPL